MKKLVKRTFGIICSFILGAQSKIFAIDETTVYGPAPDPNSENTIIDISQPSVYGPAPDPSFSSLTGGQLFSIVSSILLFIIGLIVILNKNITKKAKIITITILTITIIALILLAKFVF